MNLRLISLIAVFFFPIVSHAGVVFLNKNNTNYSLKISYQFCNWQQDNWNCGVVNTAKIDSGPKNYIVIPTPELPVGSTEEAIVILSSVVKDLNGSVVARGSYNTGPLVAVSDISTGDLSKYGWTINFNSIPEIGVVSMDYSQYQYVGSETIKLAPPAKKTV